MLAASGRGPGDAGVFGRCEGYIRNSLVRFCLLYSSPAGREEPQALSVVGLCLPATCGDKCLPSYLENSSLLPSFNFSTAEALSPYLFCSDTTETHEASLSTSGVVFATVGAAALFLVVLATIYDYVYGVTLMAVPWQRVRRNSDGNVVHEFSPPARYTSVRPVVVSADTSLSSRIRFSALFHSTSSVTANEATPVHAPDDNFSSSAQEPLLDSSTTGGKDVPTPKEGGSFSFESLNHSVQKLNVTFHRLLSELPELPNFRSVLVRCVLCLSLINSFRKWRYYPKGANASINIFNSLRVIFWLWIVCVDTFSFTQQVPTYSSDLDESGNFLYAFVQKEAAAAFAIGSFLVISGFTSEHRLSSSIDRPVSATQLVVASSMSDVQHATAALKWYARFIASRIVRILPLLGSVIFILPVAVSQTGHGPFWQTFLRAPSLHGNCRENWWPSLLFLSNMLPTAEEDRCFPWTYYIALEFQFVIVSPLLHYVFKAVAYRKVAWGSAFVLLGTLALRYFEQSTTRCHSLAETPLDYALRVDPVFQLPHVMFLPFFVGSLLCRAYRAVLDRDERMKLFGADANIMLRHEMTHATEVADVVSFWLLQKLQLKRFRVSCIWFGFSLLIGSVVASWRLGLSGNNCTTWRRLFVAVGIVPWCLGLALLLLPMLFGFGGMFRKILTHRLWCGVSRLVLAAYIIHPVVLLYSNALRTAPESLQTLLFGMDVWGHVWASLLVAFVFHLVVEQPSMHLGS